MRVRWTVALFAMVLSASACKRSGSASSPPDEGGARPRGADLRVEAVEPVLERAFGLQGQVTFDARKVARIGAPTFGRAHSVHVVVGDRVSAGDTLVKMTAPEVASLQSQAAIAHRGRLLREAEYERAIRLLERGAGSEADVLAARSELARVSREEQRALATLDALNLGASGGSSVIRSPIRGTVVESHASIGSQLSPNDPRPLFVIADLGTVWVLADLHEQDLTSVSVGDSAEIRAIGAPDATFVGNVTDVGKVLDPVTHSTHVRVEVDNERGLLRPGMFARVELNGRPEGAVRVPLAAVLAERDRYFVFVERAAGRFERRTVTLGETHGQHVVVLAGLEPGDRLVTEGAVLLDAEANRAL